MLCRIILAHFARLTTPVNTKKSSSRIRDVKRSSNVRHKLCLYAKRSSPLLDLGAAQSGVDALVHEIPVDLGEHLVDVARLGAEEGALAIGRGLEELNGEAAGAHLGRDPDPTLAIINDLRSFVHAIADAALGDEHGSLHLHHQPLHANLDVLLADGTRGWALPQTRVALEALGRELTMEELDDKLRHNRALGRVAAAA